MCAHSSSGAEITEKIGAKLYPFIDELFKEITDYVNHTSICSQADRIFEQIFKLKSEFESLRNYELKLVFPSVLKVFNTKDNPDARPNINIAELQELTHKKEQVIMDLVNEIESEAEQIQLPRTHPVYPLLFVFQTSFAQEKEEWNRMLLGWNKSCACFSAANHHHN